VIGNYISVSCNQINDRFPLFIPGKSHAEVNTGGKLRDFTITACFMTNLDKISEQKKIKGPKGAATNITPYYD